MKTTLYVIKNKTGQFMYSDFCGDGEYDFVDFVDMPNKIDFFTSVQEAQNHINFINALNPFVLSHYDEIQSFVASNEPLSIVKCEIEIFESV